MSYGTALEEHATTTTQEQNLLNINTSTSNISDANHGEQGPETPLQPSNKEHRQKRHTHTHNGAPTCCIYTPSISPDASAQVLSSLASGIKSQKESGGNHNYRRSPHTEPSGTQEPISTGSAKQTDEPGKSRKATIIRRSFQSPNGTGTAIALSTVEKEAALRDRITEAVDSFTRGNKNAANTLAEIARTTGIPASLRESVWPILLETHPLVRAAGKAGPVKITVAPRQADLTHEIPTKRIRAELSRYHRRRKNIPNTRHPSPPRSRSPGIESPASFSTPTSTVSPPDQDTLDQAMLDSAVEDAIVAYLEGHGSVQYSPGMVYVCLTLSDWLFVPPSVSNDQENQSAGLARAFEQMMAIMLWSPPQVLTKNGNMQLLDGVLTRRISHFLTIFRKLMPELAAYFDEEEANGFGEEWVHNWIQWWCSRELPKDDKARLWDFYLGYRPTPRRPLIPTLAASNGDDGDVHIDSSDGDGEDEPPPRPVLPGNVNGGAPEAYTPADWHPFVCLALLRACKDALEELELSEIRTLLTRLPRINMEAILREAGKMRKELREMSIREDEEALRRGS
ncbi:MAG: Protein required for Brome mosaic virus replication [Trichoglossum hirsutum]|nr:MAG: Protein required for Brome mosaic virus replication [Trichoglossum hirsutum]